jgi:hypothetical protein
MSCPHEARAVEDVVALAGDWFVGSEEKGAERDSRNERHRMNKLLASKGNAKTAMPRLFDRKLLANDEYGAGPAILSIYAPKKTAWGPLDALAIRRPARPSAPPFPDHKRGPMVARRSLYTLPPPVLTGGGAGLPGCALVPILLQGVASNGLPGAFGRATCKVRRQSADRPYTNRMGRLDGRLFFTLYLCFFSF